MSGDFNMFFPGKLRVSTDKKVEKWNNTSGWSAKFNDHPTSWNFQTTLSSSSSSMIIRQKVEKWNNTSSS